MLAIFVIAVVALMLAIYAAWESWETRNKLDQLGPAVSDMIAHKNKEYERIFQFYGDEINDMRKVVPRLPQQWKDYGKKN